VTGRGAERFPRVRAKAALAAASAALGDRPLQVVDRLGGGPRTSVWRVSDGTTTYVVKAYRSDEGDTFAREPAALAALTGRAAPALLAVADDPPLVVLADLGDRPSLADTLLGSDPDLAHRTLLRWVDAMAALHGTGESVAEDYARRLAERAPGRSAHVIPESLEDAAATFRRHAADLGVGVPDSVTDALLGLADGFAEESPVLTAADLCPDNNAVLEDRLVLFDFEWAEVRHRIWDVAYLRTPWPTCWCAWRLPDEVAGAGLARYRARVAPGAPYVGSSAFVRDLDHATFAWCLLTAAMFLTSALGRTRGNEGDDRYPGRRTLILDRLRHATELPGPDPLVSFAGDLHRVLLRRWGERPLPLAPAFRR
jgi:hypothetical protein